MSPKLCSGQDARETLLSRIRQSDSASQSHDEIHFMLVRVAMF